jgi:hypothetical protein
VKRIILSVASLVAVNNTARMGSEISHANVYCRILADVQYNPSLHKRLKSLLFCR